MAWPLRWAGLTGSRSSTVSNLAERTHLNERTGTVATASVRTNRIWRFQNRLVKPTSTRFPNACIVSQTRTQAIMTVWVISSQLSSLQSHNCIPFKLCLHFQTLFSDMSQQLTIPTLPASGGTPSWQPWSANYNPSDKVILHADQTFSGTLRSALCLDTAIVCYFSYTVTTVM